MSTTGGEQQVRRLGPLWRERRHRRKRRPVGLGAWMTRWRRVFAYVLAVLLQGAAIGVSLSLSHLFPAFAVPGVLPLLVIAGVALRWGTGPSLLATLLGSALLNYVLLPPQAAWSLAPMALVATLLFFSAGLCIGVMASRTERARQEAHAASARYAQSAVAERAQRERAEQATQQLQALQSVTDAALAYVGLDDVLRGLLARVTAALGVDNTAILLLDEPTQQLVVHLAQGPEDALAGRVRVPLGQGIAGRIAASRQPLIVEDTATVEAVNPFLHESIRSLMGVPLLVQERVLGVLHVGTVAPHRFTPDDLRLLRLVADRVALALDHARLYAAAQAARAQAEQAVRLRDDILTVATHDLRTPLTSVRGRADVVRLRVQAGVPLEAAWLDIQMQGITEAVGRLSATIDEMSDVARLQVGQALELHWEDLEVGALVHTALADYSLPVPGAPPVQVHLPAGAAGAGVQGDRARLLRVLHNLIGNAVKYSHQGSPVCVSVAVQEPWVVVSVRDQGVGIPAEELPQVFTRFFRASTAQGIPGTGIGLAGARAIVEQHGGQLTLESAVGQGTTVTMRLPLGQGTATETPR